MKVHGSMSINGKQYSKGDTISPWSVYPFFLFHMGMFGGSGFFMAYFSHAPTFFIYLHGGIAVLVYLAFYLTIFGADQVKWMLINAGLGIFGLYAEIDYLLSLANTQASDFAWYRHVIPFAYYVLYTFLLRQIALHITGSHDDPEKAETVSYIFTFVSFIVYFFIYLS